MEEENLDLEYTTKTKERPTFISVLCILSWIYVAITVLSSLNGSLTSQEEVEAQLEVSRAQIEESPMASNEMMQEIMDFSEDSLENAKTMNLMTLVLMLVEGLAVFMMFKLNKIGFWIYLATNLILIIGTAYMVPWPNIMSTMTIGFTGLITAVFLILYGVNLKHMK
jgi:hypothetical protein